MKRITLVLIACCLNFGLVFAQFNSSVSNVGTNSAAFLEIGVGARAMAMGGSYVSLSNDPTAVYYNPSGIVWMNTPQIELMHNEWLVDTNFDFVAFTMPLPLFSSAIGVSLTLLNYGEQEIRTTSRPEGVGLNYSARDYAVSFTYAQALTDRFSFGLTGKYINQKILNTSGGTAALDIGIFYSTPFRGLNLGMSISNFGGEISISGRDLETVVDPDPDNETINNVPVRFKTDSYPLPQIFRAGISYNMNWGSFGSLVLSTDVLHPSNSTESVNFGVEYGYGGVFFLRAGHENTFEEDAINGLTLGGGIDYRGLGGIGLRVDYAYSDWGVLQTVHRFSLGLVFN